jgi:pilin isopeptide linkage protein
VGAQNGAVAVTSATYSTGDGTERDFTSGSVLTFNNKLSLSGSMKLQVKKTVSGRTEGVQAGEFSFNVLKNGNVIKDKDGNELVFYTQQGGLVDITIPLTQDDIGTQDFVIKEIVPTGSDADPSISYTASPVIATVTISEIPATANTTASVAATSDVTYTGQTDSDGVPLMVNKYSATGTLTLHGTKRLYYGNQLESIRANEFNFVVMEGNTKVATGTTINELDNNIVFTDINYVAADIGRHTYTITEVNDGELFVEYTDKVVTVTVDVYDKGNGELGATATYSGETDGKSNALFVNTLTFKVPTGIRLDVLPYVLILVLALALGGGALVLRRRKHTKN